MEEDGEDGKKEKAGWFFFNKMGVFCPLRLRVQVSHQDRCRLMFRGMKFKV